MNAIERLREVLPPADHDPPCEHGRCAAHRDLAAVDALYQDMKRIAGMAGAAGYGETPAKPIAEIAAAAVRRIEGDQ